MLYPNELEKCKSLPHYSRKSTDFFSILNGLVSAIRTRGILNPNQALYQAELILENYRKSRSRTYNNHRSSRDFGYSRELLSDLPLVIFPLKIGELSQN